MRLRQKTPVYYQRYLSVVDIRGTQQLDTAHASEETQHGSGTGTFYEDILKQEVTNHGVEYRAQLHINLHFTLRKAHIRDSSDSAGGGIE
jgi:hypothetical protein